MSIERVIAHARRPGGFTEHRHFTVAREQAIVKMRKFTLPNPWFYVLQLIQAAIANGAHYLEMNSEGSSLTVYYPGGGLSESELAHLFDFLFASKHDSSVAHLRELAVGINGAFRFSPERIVIESGDGTAVGTSRMVIFDHDQVRIGRADRSFAGTYIRFEGLEVGWEGVGESVLRVLYDRCLATPVPIIVDGEPVFGYSAVRCPAIFGYPKTVQVDEGDLYGTLGLARGADGSVQLLTHGVWISKTNLELVPAPHGVGGIMCFDALRKTADHFGIVADEKMEELRARLRPYAEQLVYGRRRSSAYGATTIEGYELSVLELRELTSVAERILVVPPDVRDDPALQARGRSLARGLDAEIISMDTSRLGSLRSLARGAVTLLTPNLRDDRELGVLLSPSQTLPARPWLVGPESVDPVETEAILGDLSEDERTYLKWAVPDGVLDSVVYTPARRSSPPGTLLVRIVTLGRTIREEALPSSYPGHVLVVTLPDMAPGPLLDDAGDAVLSRVSELMVVKALASLETAARRVTSVLDPDQLDPGSTAAAVVLSRIARSVLARLGSDGLTFTTPGSQGSKLTQLVLFRTLAGSDLSLADVAASTRLTHGLVYGTIPEVSADLEGLDRGPILDLDAASERAIVELVGDGSYVRVDGRDVLAEHDGVRCRDMALGLRVYPDFPLLVEGRDPQELDLARRQACETALVRQLVDRVLGLAPSEPRHGAEARETWEEGRRQAALHLQYYVLRATAEGRDPAGVDRLPLFLDEEGVAHSLASMLPILRGPGIRACHGHALGQSELGRIVDAVARHDEEGVADPGHPFRVSPFLMELLRPIGEVRPVLEVETGAPAAGGEAVEHLVVRDLDNEALSGRLTIPVERPEQPAVLLVGPQGGRHVLGELGQLFDVVGVARSTVPPEDALDDLVDASRELIGEVLDLLDGPEVEPHRRRRATEVLLEFARTRITLVATGARVTATISDPLAEEVIHAPLFPTTTGVPVSAHVLLRRICDGRDLGSLSLVPDLEPHLARFVAALTDSRAVIRQPSTPARVDVAPPPADADPGARVGHWLAGLRPDRPAAPARVFVLEYEGDDAPVSGGPDALYLNAAHPVVAPLAQDPRDGEAMLWVLLSAYGYLNANLAAVTDEHERVFHLRAIEAFFDGKLGVTPARSPG